MSEIVPIIQHLVDGKHLSLEESIRAFQIMLSGGATPAQIAAVLVAIKIKGETKEELLGAAKVMRTRAIPIHAPEGCIDTCGTGGDAKHTLNISTAVAFVVAACDVPVAKHGNRAVSSKSGSADILRALGVNVDAETAIVEKCLTDVGIGFMFAPQFHHALRHIGPTRLELGIRTIFNFLGPLANPAKPPFQLIGVSDRRMIQPMAEAILELGTSCTWVVHGDDGLDEITTTGITYVVEIKNNQMRDLLITPEEAGLPRATLLDLQGRDPEHNAMALHRLLKGEPSAYRDIVLLNAAACLVISGKTAHLKDGVERAAEAIDSGKALEALANLIHVSSTTVPTS